MARFKALEKRKLNPVECKQPQYIEQPNPDSWRNGLTTAQRGYGGRWQKARLTFLNREPLCRICKAAGLITPATVVDHIEPHRGNQDLFWNTDNWQPLCTTCHDAKTKQENAVK